ncbi:MAG: hypothetical protein NDJ94_05280 [Vicinamibacteria bacterium]|nr:hypothetical protein [Vicinamibacteria bacterium]
MTSTEDRGGSRWRMAMWGGAALALLTPWVAMRVTGTGGWDLFDFVLFGTLLSLACASVELATRMSTHHAYRAGFGLAVGTAFMMTWANLAVGLIGDEGNPANLMYFGVLALGVCGALVARFEAGGMARALHAMAIAQVLVAVIALATGHARTFVLTGFLVAAWLISARLFRNAAAVHPHP